VNQKTLVTIAVVGGAGVLIYLYLSKSGKLSQWFGSDPTNSFTDETSLLAYCLKQNLQVDNGGQAVFVDSTGAQHTASCADWLSAQQNQSGGAQAAGLSAADVAQQNPAIDRTLLMNLRQAAMAVLGKDLANIPQWNLMLRELDQQAAPLESDQVGNMTAEQYLALRIDAGLTQLAPQPESYTNPAAWVN
jgi:hypothetical protein